ncbi:helix-turn-helix transcriptional regulator [Aestuariimicrobium ganziense]|uniref:helix-turn-helix transcriptional regulator n=1 Tax=Aestuariimicrobium ganziense TaxID=2773677 RepID=UPI0019439963|nr:WYL domain-containing protein [Aestuariimicrobium ganziense]
MTDPTSRALELLGLLESRPVWSGPDLARRLGVTTRTLRRDVDRLRLLGYPVHAEPGAAGGYSLGRGAALPPLLLDDDEALAVTISLSTSTANGLVPDGEAALRALGKLDAVLPGAVRERSRQVRDSLRVQPGFGAQTDPDVLTAATEALRRHLRLRFDYVDRLGAASSRWVEPHQLIASSGHWQLFAWDVHRRDWRTFRLDRATSAEVSGWEFRPRADLAEALARRGMPRTAYRHQLRVRIEAGRDEVLAEMPWAARELSAIDPHATLFETGVEDADEGAGWLARLRWDFVVLEPDEVAAALVRLGDRLARAGNRRARRAAPSADIGSRP